MRTIRRQSFLCDFRRKLYQHQHPREEQRQSNIWCTMAILELLRIFRIFFVWEKKNIPENFKSTAADCGASSN